MPTQPGPSPPRAATARLSLARLALAGRLFPGRRLPGLLLIGTLGAGLLLAACQRESATPSAPVAAVATRPADAVRLLTRHLRDNDLAAFTRDAVPPAIYAQLQTAWREGRTRWPLGELPLGRRLPEVLGALAAPGSEAALGKVFDKQFANADREIDSAASTLGLFGVQYVQAEGDFSADQREHYSQLIVATSRWAQQAPLADKVRGHAAIARLATAARKTGLRTADDFTRYGLEDSLRRLGPFVAAGKRALAGYGMDLDASLGAMDVRLQAQTGDTAQVRMRYELAGQPIDAVVAVERIDGRWYVSDFLRGARAALKAAPAGGKAPPGQPAAPAKAGRPAPSA